MCIIVMFICRSPARGGSTGATQAVVLDDGFVSVVFCVFVVCFGGEHKQTTREDQSPNGKFRIRVSHRLLDDGGFSKAREAGSRVTERAGLLSIKRDCLAQGQRWS